MSYLLRQLSYHLARGNVKSAVPAAREWDFEDIDDRLVLIIGEGRITGGSRNVPASGSFSIPLPPNYDITQPLVCFISSYARTKVTFMRVDTTQCDLLSWGAADREATLYFTDIIPGSIIISNGESEPTFIRYLLFQQPDLNSSDSFRGGSLNFGVDTNG